ncbi:hypothetical protein QBC35DRAFT_456800 [Podospora australis]|uniref:Tail specific protease domain-containing protein n=1 Tax=Podospora australis TaxID=1536484 RepID=A0AAN7AD89_9PEZI|nr:hypothetical protein QBC35DRAFT_456800 [Podospora australis]
MLLWGFLLLGSAVDAAATARPPRSQLHQRSASRAARLSARAEDNTARPACGRLWVIVKSDLADGNAPIFDALDVWNCIRTVPFHAAPALRFIEYYNTTLQFHSTVAYLKYPTPHYKQPAVDIFAELGRVKQNVEAGKYKRQYDFEVDVLKITHAMHDHHASLSFGITAPFVFASSADIVSASLDGKSLPRPYLKYDLIKAQDSGWKYEPSPIATINGKDAVEYLTEFARFNSFGNLESHADYNDLFEHPANDIQGVYGTWGGQVKFYPGNDTDDSINIVFANNTKHGPEQWVAILEHMSTPSTIETPGDMYNYFILGLMPANADDEELEPLFPDLSNLTLVEVEDDVGTWPYQSDGAFPEAQIAQPNLKVAEGGVVSGYYLDKISTGVLSIPSFRQFPEDALEFSKTVQKFIDGAEKKKLTKIIIDLQQNYGGSPGLAFDTFRRFFPFEPESSPWTFAGSRRRSHKLAEIIGDSITEWWKGLDEDDDDRWDEAGNEWNIATRINPLTNKTFQNWAEYSPSEPDYRGDRWSKVERYDMFNEEFLYSAFSADTSEDDPYGFGENRVPDNAKQVFKPSQIVLLTDGLCSSTCAIFVEMMTEAGVRTVVMGGKPENGPMQAVAGSRGARAYSADILDYIMQFAGTLVKDNSSLPNIPIDQETRDTGMWVQYAGINLRDQVTKQEFEAGGQILPLQFEYRAAHCRLFYTTRNIYNMTRLWSDVSAAAFGKDSLCVQGSTGFADEPGHPASNTAPTKKPVHAASVVIDTDNFRGGEEDFEDEDEDGLFGPPDFNEGDIHAGEQILADNEIYPCSGKNGTSCRNGWPCVDIEVKCKSSRGEEKLASTAKYCLPPCNKSSSVRTGCDTYNNKLTKESRLECSGKFRMETKKKTGVSSAAGRETIFGYCKPNNGVRSRKVCSAPAKKPTPSGTP